MSGPSSTTANVTSQMTVDAIEDMDLVTAAGTEVSDIGKGGRHRAFGCLAGSI